MPLSPSIARVPAVPLVGPDGRVDMAWQRYLQDLADYLQTTLDTVGGINSTLTGYDTRIDATEAAIPYLDGRLSSAETAITYLGSVAANLIPRVASIEDRLAAAGIP